MKYHKGCYNRRKRLSGPRWIGLYFDGCYRCSTPYACNSCWKVKRYRKAHFAKKYKGRHRDASPGTVRRSEMNYE